MRPLAGRSLRTLLLKTTVGHRLASVAAVAIAGIVLTMIVVHFANPRNAFDIDRISVADIAHASANTFYRMLVAYLLSVIVAVPLALLIAVTPAVQRILLPIADIMQSVPVLAFFPIVVAFFTQYRAFEAAAILVIFMAMVWNIVFPVIGGLQTIPDDIRSAAHVFGLRGIRKFWHVTLPAIFPFIVTGSLLAWAQGWTVVIVAEVLHTYIPDAGASADLLGLGSLLVDSNAQQKTSVFVAALCAMILMVALIDILVWQPLLRLAQRFRFD